MKRAKLMLGSDFRSLVNDRTSGDTLDAASGLPIAIVRGGESTIDPTYDLEGSTDRTIPYLFCTEKVARDGHTVSVQGFDLTGFNANPVFLWAHDSDEPPIGRVVNLERQNGVMRGSVEYMDADLSPFADMIFRMVKKRFINATSISWLPLEWKFSTDRTRQGGIDFIKEDLLEISQVPVPAQATALATARAAGIDTGPMMRWAEKVLDGGGIIMIPRAELELLRNVSKMPVAAKRRSMLTGNPVVTIEAKPIKRKFSRDLYQVAELANVLMWLDWIQDYAEWEAEIEGDNSDIPARLLATLQELGGILKDMTVEEVNELIGEEGDVVDDMDIITVASQAARTPAQRAVLAMAKIARQNHAHIARKFVIETDQVISSRVAEQLRAGVDAFFRNQGSKVMVLEKGMRLREITPEAEMPLTALIEKRVRAGRVLNAANEQALRDACALIDGVVAQVSSQTEEPEVSPASGDLTPVEQAAQRVREAEALALQNPGE